MGLQALVLGAFGDRSQSDSGILDVDGIGLDLSALGTLGDFGGTFDGSPGDFGGDGGFA